MPRNRIIIAVVIGLASAAFVGADTQQPTDIRGRDKALGRLADPSVGRWVAFAPAEPSAGGGEADGTEIEQAVRRAVESLDFGSFDPAPAVDDLLRVLGAWRTGDVGGWYEHRSRAGAALDRALVREGLLVCVRWGWLSAERGTSIESADDRELAAMLMEAQRGSGFVIEAIDADTIRAGFGVMTEVRSDEWPPSGMVQFDSLLIARAVCLRSGSGSRTPRRRSTSACVSALPVAASGWSGSDTYSTGTTTPGRLWARRPWASNLASRCSGASCTERDVSGRA